MAEIVNKEKTNGIRIKIEADTTELDAAIEKATRLVTLLEKASELIKSLSTKN